MAVGLCNNSMHPLTLNTRNFSDVWGRDAAHLNLNFGLLSVSTKMRDLSHCLTGS